MGKCNQPELIISGLGVISAIGRGKEAFIEALLRGRHGFGVMQRPGRQKGTSFIGAEIPSLSFPERISKKLVRNASFSAQAALAALDEAWEEAALDKVDPTRIGLIIGGSNIQQRELLQTYEAYHDRSHFIKPTYGLAFMESDLFGLCTEQFGIKVMAHTLGGASASGQVSIIQGIQAVLSGQVDICIAMGALTDLSYLECQALRTLGAMGTDRFADKPEKACRPFDKNHDGFIFGEACGAVVIERSGLPYDRSLRPYAALKGWAVSMDGNRNPNPSYEGEVKAIKFALNQAGLSPEKIDYINPHGTGSVIGDETELNAIRDCGLSHAYIYATKSITGHGLTAAGNIEIIAVLLQMREGQLHPTRNLEEPIDKSFNWVGQHPVSHTIKRAINLSMGFGGINSAVCVEKI